MSFYYVVDVEDGEEPEHGPWPTREQAQAEVDELVYLTGGAYEIRELPEAMR